MYPKISSQVSWQEATRGKAPTNGRQTPEKGRDGKQKRRNPVLESGKKSPQRRGERRS